MAEDENTRPVMVLNIPPSGVKVGAAAETEFKKLSRSTVSAKPKDKIMTENKPKFKTLAEALGYYQNLGLSLDDALKQAHKHRNLVSDWIDETVKTAERASGG